MCMRRATSGGKGPKNDSDEAIAVVPDKGKPGGRNDAPKKTCWNCGKEGHFQVKCPKPRKSDNRGRGAGPKPAGLANVVECENEFAFFVGSLPTGTYCLMTQTA